MWSQAVRLRNWSQSLPKAQTMARKKELQAKNLGFFLKATLEFENCLETCIPFVSRLNNLGKILDQTNRFVAIDRELLFYVASVRWLAKNHSYQLAEATLNQYEALNLKLSDGRSKDVLNIAGDLYSRFWYKSQEHVSVLEKLKNRYSLKLTS